MMGPVLATTNSLPESLMLVAIRRALVQFRPERFGTSGTDHPADVLSLRGGVFVVPLHLLLGTAGPGAAAAATT
jgi:hypothetical protein